jgi:UDPglucose--hexose-1-phosphate uridylyltransferase
VVCYTPTHNPTLAELPVAEISALLRTWRDQYLELGARPEVRHVLTFENKGEVVGVSNPHPHGQIYATNFVFKTIETEAAASRRHWQEHGRALFQDIVRAERTTGAEFCTKARRRSSFFPTSRDTRTSATWRRRRRTPASRR